MQLDPDQREWLYQEEQERLRWKRRLEHQPGDYSKWMPAIIAGILLLVLLAVIVTSDTFRELMIRIAR